MDSVDYNSPYPSGLLAHGVMFFLLTDSFLAILIVRIICIGEKMLEH